MPINARDCYSTPGDIERCDGVSSSNLTLVGIVGERPSQKSDSQSQKSELPQNSELGLPDLEIEMPQGKTKGVQPEPPLSAEGVVQSEPKQSKPEQPGPAQSKQSQAQMDRLPPIGRLPRGFEQFEFPQNLKPAQSKYDKQVNDLVLLLPDHPIRAVSKSLLKGLFSGEFDRQETASAMLEFTRAFKNQDITNLPSVSSNDFPLGDASEMSLRLRKASLAFNDALKPYGLKMEVIDGRGIVIHNRNNYQPVNIGVRLSGEVFAFEGKIERRNFKPMLVQDAVAALKPLIAAP